MCVYYMKGTPEGSSESGFMDKPGIEPATPGLQGIALIHYTTGASLAPTVPGDELVRFRLECKTRMYEQSTDILDQTEFAKRFSYDCCTVPSTICYGLVR